MFDDKHARGGRRRTSTGFGNAFAGRGESTSTRAIGALPPAAARHRAGDAEPVATRGRSLARFVQRARADARAIVAPVGRDAGVAVRATSTRRSPRSRRSRGRSSRTRSPRARRRSTPAIAGVPAAAPVPAPTPTGLFARAAARRARAAHGRAGRSPTRSRSARRCCQDARRRSTARLELAAPGARSASPTTRSSPLGVKRPDRARVEIAQPDARLPRAGPDGLQLRDAVVPQRLARCSARATATAPGSASSSSPRRRARTTRAARPRRRPTARPRTTTCTPTRTRTRRRRASRRSARRATSRTLVGKTGHRQRARARSRPRTRGARRRELGAARHEARRRARTAPARTPSRSALIVLRSSSSSSSYFGFTKDIPFTHGFRAQGRRSSRRTRSGRTRRCGSPASSVGKVKSDRAACRAPTRRS